MKKVLFGVCVVFFLQLILYPFWTYAQSWEVIWVTEDTVVWEDVEIEENWTLVPVTWCTNVLAKNYSSEAEVDDGTCRLESWKRSSVEWNIAPVVEESEDNMWRENGNNEFSWEPQDSSNNELQKWSNDTWKKEIEEVVEAVVSDTTLYCNETQYIMARRAMLEAEAYETVYIIPQYYSQLLWEEAMKELNRKVETMRQMSPLERNALIESIVCKIEAVKESRNLKYANVWAPAQWNAADYLSQYLQDMMILWYVWN